MKNCWTQLDWRCHHQPQRLLWVDDKVGSYLRLVRSLRGNGLSVLPVQSAREGWNILRNEQVHLAIVDLKLDSDEPNGVDFCVEAREMLRPKRLPILVYTGFLELFEERLPACEPDCVLEKSHSDREDLSNAVFDLIGGRPWCYLRPLATRLIHSVETAPSETPREVLARTNTFADRVADYIVREKRRPNVSGTNIATAAQMVADVLCVVADWLGHLDPGHRDALLSLSCFWRMRAAMEDPVD